MEESPFRFEVGQPRDVEVPLGGTTTEYQVTCGHLRVSKTLWECEDLFKKIRKEFPGFKPGSSASEARQSYLQQSFSMLSALNGIEKSLLLSKFMGGKLVPQCDAVSLDASLPAPSLFEKLSASKPEAGDLFGENSSTPSLFGRLDLDEGLELDEPTEDVDAIVEDEADTAKASPEEASPARPAAKPSLPPKPQLLPRPKLSERTVFGPETTNGTKEKQKSPVPLPRSSKAKVDADTMSSADILNYIEQEQKGSQGDDLVLF